MVQHLLSTRVVTVDSLHTDVGNCYVSSEYQQHVSRLKSRLVIWGSKKKFGEEAAKD